MASAERTQRCEPADVVLTLTEDEASWLRGVLLNVQTDGGPDRVYDVLASALGEEVPDWATRVSGVIRVPSLRRLRNLRNWS